MDRNSPFQNCMVIDLYINAGIVIYFLNHFLFSSPTSPFFLARQKGKTDKNVQ